VDPRSPGERQHPRLWRGVRFIVAGILCWSLLIAVALGFVKIKDDEAEAARAALPSPRVELSARETYRWRHFPEFREVIPILAYHGINDDGSYLSVTRRHFAEQLLALKTAGFHTVTIAQYAHFAATGDTEGLPRDPILLTFDDGRLDSYRGADQTLARFHDTATMFVVAAWPEAKPGWALHWSELAKMAESGRWDIQEHAGDGHHHVIIDAAGKKGEFYAFRRFQNGGLESFAAYRRRVSDDVRWGERMLGEHIPGYRPLAFAVPYSNYGQRETNDPRIPKFFFSFLHSQFPVVVDGDYLDEEFVGDGRPAEILGRGGHRISYRITQGPADTLPVLACRLRDFVLKVPIWREYACIQSNSPQGGEQSVYSE
jgi:peptidoglycan/xylan/chitin deacetylase (PgdA/CDA1 family)